MKRVKQYRVRLTEEEDELLKQKARDLGLSAADIIRLGIKYYLGEMEFARLTERRFTELRSNSEFIRNWERTFAQSVLHEFGKTWQDLLQLAYLQILNEYKDLVYYTDGKFILSVAEESTEALPVMQETEPVTISEQKVIAEICRFLIRNIRGEWKGDEGIVHAFIAGLKADLARSI